MAKPKIARRCSVCGASIRKAALFCPQCGEELIQQNLEAKPAKSVVTAPLVDSLPVQGAADAESPRADPDEKKLEPVDDKKLEPVDEEKLEPEDEEKLEPVDEEKLEPVDEEKLEPGDEEKLEPLEDGDVPAQKTPAVKAPAGTVRNKIQRATNLARDGGGDMIHRVQKVRQISSVVLDEAGYDPSLRFVLVAAALFLLFLLVLLLNKMIG